jgi:hypothetical protein
MAGENNNNTNTNNDDVDAFLNTLDTEGGEPSEGETDLQKALKTIEKLSADVEELRRPRRVETRQEPEVTVEQEDILGVKLPKDRTKRPIQLTDDDLVKVGWNDNPRVALENLGNLLFVRILDAAIGQARTIAQNTMSVQRTRSSLKEKFFNDNPDLKDHADLLDMTEGRLRADGLRDRVKTGSEYLDTVAKETRTRIAAIRGVSYDDYMASIAKGATGGNGGTTTSGRVAGRAVTAGAGGRGGTTSQPTGFAKDAADLLADGR